MTVIMDKVKRERSANFTSYETRILISLVQKYQTVLENKQSDARTWKKKETVWKIIGKEFNARSREVFRSIKTLRLKYEGLKRTARKKSEVIRSELSRIGCGKNTVPPLDNVVEQIKTMITISTDGLESIYDSDSLQQTQGNQEVIIENPETVFVKNEFDVLPAASTESPLDIKCTNILEHDINDKTLHVAPNDKHIVTPTSTSEKWDVTSRNHFKSRKRPALIASTQKSQFDVLTKAKLELFQLQKELVEAEIIEKKKEWAFKENERKWKEEEYKLRIAKLKKELNE